MSDPLVAFLLEQIAEDERVAQAARALSLCLSWPRQAGKATYLAYANRFDPARMLAEVEAKRRMLGAYERSARYWEAHPPSDQDWRMMTAEMDVIRLTLRLLALPYADRPGYDSAWKVGE